MEGENSDAGGGWSQDLRVLPKGDYYAKRIAILIKDF